MENGDILGVLKSNPNSVQSNRALTGLHNGVMSLSTLRTRSRDDSQQIHGKGSQSLTNSQYGDKSTSLPLSPPLPLLSLLFLHSLHSLHFISLFSAHCSLLIAQHEHTPTPHARLTYLLALADPAGP